MIILYILVFSSLIGAIALFIDNKNQKRSKQMKLNIGDDIYVSIPSQCVGGKVLEDNGDKIKIENL